MNSPGSQKIFAPLPESRPSLPGGIPPERLELWGVRLAAGLAILLSLYLTYAAWFTAGTVAGCGDESLPDCNTVLNSRWSRWLGLPMGLWAALLYGGMLAATFWSAKTTPAGQRRWAWLGLTAGSLLAAGGAMWFVALQLLTLYRWCWYCAGVHLCGLILAGWVAWRLPPMLIEGEFALADVKRGAMAGAGALLLLIVGQVLFNSAPGMKVVAGEVVEKAQSATSTTKTGAANPTAPAAEPDPAAQLSKVRQPRHPWPHRRTTLANGGVSLDLYDYPVIGDRQSPVVMVKLFDYTCSHCRELEEMLRQAEEKLSDRPATVLICVPMNTACNRHARVNDEKHKYACDLAKLAVAVWQLDPDKFYELHAWLMQGSECPDPAAAQAQAAALVGEQALKRQLSEVAVAAQLAENCRLYSVIRDNSRDGSIPKLVFGNSIASGLPNSQTQLELLLQAQGLTVKRD